MLTFNLVQRDQKGRNYHEKHECAFLWSKIYAGKNPKKFRVYVCF